MSLPRERLEVPAHAVLRLLPAIGRLMVTANNLGATHERIGTVEQVAEQSGWTVITGAEHESRIETGAVASITLDRTSVMKDKHYPRIDLLTADGTVICGIVGFDGLEPFDAALAVLGPGIAVEPKPEKPGGDRGDVSPTDPGAEPFNAALSNASPISIEFRQPHLFQVWRGVVEGVKPAMGFINVMRSDFHLHLKAGAVAEWRHMRQGELVELTAVDANGAELGLVLTGPAAAFEARIVKVAQ